MIAAVLTAYKPDVGFVSRFLPLLSVCDLIIISDNTPAGCNYLQFPEGFVVIHNKGNVGLGPALNIGIAEARRKGAEHVVLFDQDSTPSPGFVCEMLVQLDAIVMRHGLKCCLGPTHIDDSNISLEKSNVDTPMSFKGCSLESVQKISCLPTSGMIFSIEALAWDDQFSEELFLDLVDFEWCWRLGIRGWKFFRTSSVQMYHRLGETERRFLGITFYVPAPYRHYFQTRDTLLLSVEPYVPIYSKIRLLGVLPIKFLIYPFLLDSGFERLKWMLFGLRDSILKVRGIGAVKVRLS
jgi:rhamnosyltransferase